MKRLIIASLWALLALTLLSLISPAARADETTCEGSLGAVTVDNLRVLPNAGCTLDGTRVEGTIKIENGASLTATQVTVIGNVQAEGAEVVNVLAGSTVSGSIQIKQGGAAEVDEVRVNGDIQFESNDRGLSATRNQVGGNVQAFQNMGGVTIADNIIYGNLQCKENDPAPTGESNLVLGNIEDQCAGLGVELHQRMFLPSVELIADALDCNAPVTVFADADAWIDENSSSNNFGTDAILKVRSQGPSDNFRALVRFALPADVPAGCVVELATLRLYAASATTDRTLEALRVAGDWSENAVTWSNQPGTTGDAVTTASGLGYREWSVAAQVQAMYDTGTNHGFLIRDAAEGGLGFEQQFHSREKGETPPMLVITFAPAGG